LTDKQFVLELETSPLQGFDEVGAVNFVSQPKEE
jgi:hypothetical protein